LELPLTLTLSPRGEGTDRGVFSKYIDLKIPSRTQVLKSMEIGPLSPSPPWGEGWGEGWI
jgi:hypothetical protein